MHWHDRPSIPSEVLAEHMLDRNREFTLTVTVTNSQSQSPLAAQGIGLLTVHSRRWAHLVIPGQSRSFL